MALPAPALRSRGLRYAVFASEGSAVALHAQNRRIFATKPRLTTDSKPELDAVYAALAEAGIAKGELDALDAQLDEEIIARQEGLPT
jgi:hypothetical protein